MDTIFVDAGHNLLLVYGLPALFFLFFIKGFLLGRFFPPIIFLPLSALLFVNGVWSGIAVLLITIVATTIGQYAIYYLIDKRGEYYVRNHKYIPISDKQIDKLVEWFDDVGNISVLIGNVIPGVHGLMAIPAVLSNIRNTIFILYSFIGNAIYFSIIMIAFVFLRDIIPYI